MEKNLFLIILLFVQCNIIKTLDNEILDNKKGEIGDYTYELWKDNGQTRMTLIRDGTFSCTWNTIGTVLFRIGKRWEGKKYYQEIGNIIINYEFDYKSNGTSHYAIYGMTIEPMTEFYILENWEGPLPSAHKCGLFFADGSNYDIYKTDLPYIGDKLTQIWSIRKKQRNKGTVSVNEHFKEWAKNSIKLGKLIEVSFCEAKVTKNQIIIE